MIVKAQFEKENRNNQWIISELNHSPTSFNQNISCMMTLLILYQVTYPRLFLSGFILVFVYIGSKTQSRATLSALPYAGVLKSILSCVLVHDPREVQNHMFCMRKRKGGGCFEEKSIRITDHDTSTHQWGFTLNFSSIIDRWTFNAHININDELFFLKSRNISLVFHGADLKCSSCLTRSTCELMRLSHFPRARCIN